MLKNLKTLGTLKIDCVLHFEMVMKLGKKECKIIA